MNRALLCTSELNADPIRTRVGFRADVTPRLEMQRSETKTYGTDCNAMYDQRPYFDFDADDLKDKFTNTAVMLGANANKVDHCSTLDTSKCTTGGDGLRARARKQRTHTKHEFDDRWGPLAQWHQDSGPSLHWDTVT